MIEQSLERMNEEYAEATRVGGAILEIPAPIVVHDAKSYLVVKRLADLVLSFIALIALSPLLLVIAVAIKLDSKGPVIYTQTRIGKDGKPFRMYKFRSMCADAEEKLPRIRHLNEVDGPVFKIADDPRVTKVGGFIRSFSIDELPQLLNIIRGEMSIVGPRPPLPSEVVQYTRYQRRRLSVIPGLTCYWQIRGRARMGFEQWVELDLQYIRERCAWVDILIIMRTFPVVFFGKGAC